MGVLVAERGGGGPLIELPGRVGGCCLIVLALVDEGGADGVFDRGGGIDLTGVNESR